MKNERLKLFAAFIVSLALIMPIILPANAMPLFSFAAEEQTPEEGERPLPAEDAITSNPPEAAEADEDAMVSEPAANPEASVEDAQELSGMKELRLNESTVTPLEAGVIEVGTEIDLRNAVENSTGSLTIELTADITMTDPYPDHPGGIPAPYPAMWRSQYASLRAALYIDRGKDITLIGNHKLIGTGDTTIKLDGILTLDGPTITHIGGVSNSGISIGDMPPVDKLASTPRAELFFKSGAVCDNGYFGIGIGYGDMLMTGGEICGNGTASGSAGGGICVAGNGSNVDEDRQFGARVTIEGGDIHDNKALYGGGFNVSGTDKVTLKIVGGNIYNNEATYGGGICGYSSAVNIEISGGNIYDNTAYYGGAVYSYNAPAIYRGDIYKNTADFGGAIFSRNSLNISGGDIYENSARYGGGIYCSANSAMTLSDTAKIRDNIAYIEEESSYGGGIYAGKNTTTTISGGEISGNGATYGGGVFAGNSYVTTISDGKIYGNEAAYGGGIYADASATTISGGGISGNTAMGSGGGMLVSGGTFDMSAGVFNGNTATYGGGIYHSSGIVNLTGGNICNNSASNPHDSEYGSGGGIYTENYSQLTVGQDVAFSGNTANKLTQLRETDTDFATYQQKIAVPNGQWSVTGVKYGYNNYDINYLGSELEIFTIKFIAGKGGSLSGVTAYTDIAQGTPFGQAVSVPKIRAAEGYVFDRWSPALPANGQPVTEDAIYTAVFVKKSVPATPPPTQPSTPPATPPQKPPQTQGRTVVVTDLPEPATPTPAPDAEQSPTVTDEISNISSPLSQGEGPSPAWALLNLILALAGVLFAIIAAVRSSRQKKYGLDCEEPESEKTKHRKTLGWLVATVILAAAGLILFLLTEDVTLPMRFVDKWTIVNAAIFVVEILLGVIALRKGERENDEGRTA